MSPDAGAPRIYDMSNHLAATPPRWTWAPVVFAGLASGAFASLNWMAERTRAPERSEALALLVGTAVVMAALFVCVQWHLAPWVLRQVSPGRARARAAALQSATWLVFLLLALGAGGFRLPAPIGTVLLILVFAGLQLVLALGLEPGKRSAVVGSPGWLLFLFFLSGMAALVYQVTWQRALFVALGVNIESVTVVVSLFMFGLGVGSLLGGALSARWAHRLPHLFLGCELLVGAFGLVSLPLIRGVGGAVATGALPLTALSISALLALPTLLMGATLPVLVAHLHRHQPHVGRVVGRLYFVNTLGSAVASYLTARLLFVVAGQQAAVLVAALLNLTVGALAWGHMRAAIRGRGP